MANGTVALQAAVAALGLGPGDEVILPTFTIISCALAVVYAGATPVLVDADPETWTMDVEAVADRITPRTSAIMAVDIYGHPAQMEPLMELARRHRLALIEDAAEAHGAECRVDGEWRRCGSFGDASCFSFYANKLVTTGEGGMVVTDDPALAARLRSLRNLSFEPDRRFYHRSLGHNFRLTNLQAALGLAQVERMEEIVARKRTIATLYRRGLADIDALSPQTELPWARSVHWMNGFLVAAGAREGRDALARTLEEQGVETRPFFVGMHRQPGLHARGLFAEESYPVCDNLADRGLYLPSGLALSDGQIEAVCAAVRSALS